jgi:hypothetical protein
MRVPVGTTVTFLNPGAATFPNFPNTKLHCATQYFEGLFNFKLNPGDTAQYTFNRAGEYFFNDCTDPRPTSKDLSNAPGPSNALRFTRPRRPGNRIGVHQRERCRHRASAHSGRLCADGDVKLDATSETLFRRPLRTSTRTQDL